MSAEKVTFSAPLPLKAFTPLASSKRNPELSYSSNLEKEAGKIIDESRRLAEIKSADGIEKDQYQRSLDMSYLVFIAFRLMSENDTNLQKMWAESFTKKSIELYGEPDKTVAMNLLAAQSTALQELDAPEELVVEYQEAIAHAGIEINPAAEEAEPFHFEAPKEALNNYLHTKYNTALEALSASEFNEPLSPPQLADRFDAGLTALKLEDPRWEDWSVVSDDEKDSLSVDHKSKSIIVGMKRAHLEPQLVEGLFAHEVLRHALSSINGNSNELPALPGYLDFEEGMGIFHEYALSGTIKDEIIDRYVDISLALGIEEGSQPLPRSKLLPIALARERLRNAQRPIDEQLTEDKLSDKVLAHVNRIYRGTPGSDEVVGVFTKDIAYLNGFLKAGKYISAQLEAGHSIDEIMEYLSQGKFDPTLESHAERVNRDSHPQPSKELVLYQD